jgi:hypothetical protein
LHRIDGYPIHGRSYIAEHLSSHLLRPLEDRAQ